MRTYLNTVSLCLALFLCSPNCSENSIRFYGFEISVPPGFQEIDRVNEQEQCFIRFSRAEGNEILSWTFFPDESENSSYRTPITKDSLQFIFSQMKKKNPELQIVETYPNEIIDGFQAGGLTGIRPGKEKLIFHFRGLIQGDEGLLALDYASRGKEDFIAVRSRFLATRRLSKAKGSSTPERCKQDGDATGAKK